MAELLAITDTDVWNKISSGVWLVFFLMLLCWVYRPGGKASYEKHGRLPLRDEGLGDEGLGHER